MPLSGFPYAMSHSAPVLPLVESEIAAFVAAALAEDVGSGDITSEAVVPEEARLRAVMAARQPLVVAGLPLAEAVLRACDPGCRIERHAADGSSLTAGAPLLAVSGLARPLLTAERTALNIVQHLSGIATLARAYVAAVAGTEARILDTRKTVPLLRRLEKYAAACGGALNHRMGLFDAVMIKDNHIAAAGSITRAVAAARAAGHRAIEVECDKLEQVEEALTAGATSLLLDNMDVTTLCRAVGRVAGRVPCEASGGVTLKTVRAIAETGVDCISVGRLTQSAPAVDIGLDVTVDAG